MAPSGDNDKHYSYLSSHMDMLPPGDNDQYYSQSRHLIGVSCGALCCQRLLGPALQSGRVAPPGDSDRHYSKETGAVTWRPLVFMVGTTAETLELRVVWRPLAIIGGTTTGTDI